MISGKTKKKKKFFDDVCKCKLKVKYDNVKVLGMGLWGGWGQKIMIGIL